MSWQRKAFATRMSTTRKLIPIASALWLSALMLGCTSTRVVEEKDALIGEQRARLEACEDNIVALRQQLNVLKMEHAQQQEESEKQLLACQEQLDHQIAEDQTLIDREKQLRERLASDIEQKNLEIEILKGRLSVKVLEKILFRSGSVVILPSGKEVLTRVAASLADATENLRIEGHTDDVPIGPVLVNRIPTNWELSVLRAASVVRFLEANNIESTRLSAAGYSMFKPVEPNTSEVNRQLNRRVEIVVVP